MKKLMVKTRIDDPVTVLSPNIWYNFEETETEGIFRVFDGLDNSIIVIDTWIEAFLII